MRGGPSLQVLPNLNIRYDAFISINVDEYSTDFYTIFVNLSNVRSEHILIEDSTNMTRWPKKRFAKHYLWDLNVMILQYVKFFAIVL